MFRKIILITLSLIMTTTVFVGCGKQEDTPIIIDTPPVATMDSSTDAIIENLPVTEDEVVFPENLPMTEDEKIDLQPLDNEYTMQELRLMRMRNMCIRPVGLRIPRLPTRPVVPVPIIRPNPEVADKIIEFLKDVILKPQPIGPIMPIYPKLGNNIVV